MSDTIPGVGWALAQSCRVRHGERWQHPCTALKQVGDLRLYSHCKNSPERDYPIFDGICVTSLTSMSAYDPSVNFRYPSSGLILSSAFGPYGGVKAVEEMCSSCPANSSASELAGCSGCFYTSKTNGKGQAQLDQIIDWLGARKDVERLFPKTKILWYCFWITSPLSREATIVLHRILQAVHEEDLNSKIIAGKAYPSSGTKALGGFVQALERSSNAGFEMHVNLAPPGHADMGWLTTFAHCPRCKMEAPVERWSRKIPDGEITCENCGAMYSPKATYSAIPYDPEDEDPTDLFKQLGWEAYERLAIKFMMSRGVSERDAVDKLERNKAAEQKRKEELAHQRELHRRNNLFVREELLAGLKNISRGKEFDEPEWGLSVHDFRIFLRRCTEQNVDVSCFQHLSESGEWDEFVTIKSAGKDAIVTFEQLVQNGLCEKCTAHVRAPGELVEAWWRLRNAKDSNHGG